MVSRQAYVLIVLHRQLGTYVNESTYGLGAGYTQSFSGVTVTVHCHPCHISHLSASTGIKSIPSPPPSSECNSFYITIEL
jgi:hypothetical protein